MHIPPFEFGCTHACPFDMGRYWHNYYYFCMYVWYIYIYIHSNMLMHTCIYVCIYTCVCVCWIVLTRTHIRTHICIYIYESHNSLQFKQRASVEGVCLKKKRCLCSKRIQKIASGPRFCRPKEISIPQYHRSSPLGKAPRYLGILQ